MVTSVPVQTCHSPSWEVQFVFPPLGSRLPLQLLRLKEYSRSNILILWSLDFKKTDSFYFLPLRLLLIGTQPPTSKEAQTITQRGHMEENQGPLVTAPTKLPSGSQKPLPAICLRPFGPSCHPSTPVNTTWSRRIAPSTKMGGKWRIQEVRWALRFQME